MEENQTKSNTFTLYDPEMHGLDELVASLVKSQTGFEVVEGSAELQFGKDWDGNSSLSFYDGSLKDQLGIGQGLLLTSGNGAPSAENNNSSFSHPFSQEFTQTPDSIEEGVNSELKANLEQVAQNLPATVNSVNDVTALTFDINVTDPGVQSIDFSFVFGSEEYPNYIDNFVDTGVIFVNDKNYALFNGEENQPLSVTSNNVQLGNFQHNSGPGFEQGIPSGYSQEDINTVELPIEYNGISTPLQVNAPVKQGVNTITVGVSDTNDSEWDSGLIMSPLQGVGYQLPEDTGITPGSSDVDWENPFADYLYDLPYELQDGKLVFGKSLDGSLVKGSPDNLIDAEFGFSVKDILNADFNINPDGKSNFVEIETKSGDSQKFVYVQKMIFDDFAAAMDTWEGSDTWNTFSLLKVGFGQDPTSEIFTEWLLKAEDTDSIEELAGLLLDEYTPEGFTQEDLVSYLYQTLTGSKLDDVDSQLSFLQGIGLNTNEEIFGFVGENYADMSAIDGSFVPLDLQVLDAQSNNSTSEAVSLAGVKADEAYAEDMVA